MPQNKEYIEREAARLAVFNTNWRNNGDVDIAYDMIDNIPHAADVVEVRHGRWEERSVNVDTPTTDLFCSECNFASYHWRYNYCPNCGAYMMGESNGKCE